MSVLPQPRGVDAICIGLINLDASVGDNRGSLEVSGLNRTTLSGQTLVDPYNRMVAYSDAWTYRPGEMTGDQETSVQSPPGMQSKY